MNTKEKFFDSKMIANLLIAFALVATAMYYINYATEIEDGVKTVIVNSLNDVNNSLAEQESTRK